jgi:pimeloyl-ACP methyl ester carboxylesterase
MRIHQVGGDQWAVLVHGFTRRGRHLDPLAVSLGSVGINTVAPDLGSFNWFRSTNNPRYLNQVAAELGSVVTGPVVLIGHSAGAAAAGHLATRLTQVRGLVFVDGNESPTRLLSNAWPHIAHLPMIAICAPPNRCNRGGRFARWAQEQGIPGCVVPGMGHGDIEGVERGIYRWACGPAGSQETRERTCALVTEAARRLLIDGRTGDVLARYQPW